MDSSKQVDPASSAADKWLRVFPPFTECQKAAFQSHLLGRFPAGEGGEGIVEYIDRILDRQVNKANGLLAFDGLLFTALSVISSATSPTSDGVKWGGTFALAAALPLIPIFIVQFGRISSYGTPRKDFEAKCQIIYSRTYLIVLSVLLSFIAAVFSLWHLWSSK